MFTGIIEEIGVVRETGHDRIVFNAHKVVKGTKVGDSIAVNGVCLTVVSLENDGFSVNVMPETFRRTNLGKLHYGDHVNLERAVALGSRLGGHLVLGHVDDVGEVVDVRSEESSRVIRVSAPAKLMPYVVERGFIAVDGVSLTIIDFDDFSFVVSLVRYTMENTTLGKRIPGDQVNLEMDIIAKYLSRLVGFKERKRQGFTLEFLKEYGFVTGTDAG